MDALEFLKERKRMCLYFGESCFGCPLNGTDCANTSNAPVERYKKNIEAVEQWSKEHPSKTRQSEFLKMFPNAHLDGEGVLSILACNADINVKDNNGDCRYDYCPDCRHDYWLQEVE